MNLFGNKRPINVPLTFEVMMKCQCVHCPVQTSSACAKPKIESRLTLVRNAEMAKNMDPEMMKNMNPDQAKAMMPDVFTSEGMMKNLEMLRNMNPEQMRHMSREDQQKMSDQMQKNTPMEQFEAAKPKAEDMPGPYCANGVASCKDLDFTKMCICTQCQIYKDYNLPKAKPTMYFCKDGKAI